MANDAGKRRERGSISKRGNSLQVLVCAGLEPLTGQRLYLSESTTDEAEAKRILNRPHDSADVGCTVVECRPHKCKPLSAATIRHVHFAISAALSAVVRWKWIKNNPAAVAKKPRQPAPQPNPPAVEQAGLIAAGAWEQDESWAGWGSVRCVSARRCSGPRRGAVR